LLRVHSYEGALPDPVQTLERYFAEGGISLLHAVFANTFFADPTVVRTRTPYFPGYARVSREHYGNLRRSETAVWAGVPVRLADNSRAQVAWARYTRPLSRGKGFGVRHIWGHPWDPAAYTAGWNLAYMPHWAGMLTEAQHPNAQIEAAVRQASWDLFFRQSPVCAPPPFVSDPGVDLEELLEGRPLLVLARDRSVDRGDGSVDDIVRALRAESQQSWSNIRKAIASLGGETHDGFGTASVEASAKRVVRKMRTETGLELAALSDVVKRVAAR
jgi:hypothetical protein